MGAFSFSLFILRSRLVILLQTKIFEDFLLDIYIYIFKKFCFCFQQTNKASGIYKDNIPSDQCLFYWF